jgi:hypothetical protein
MLPGAEQWCQRWRRGTPSWRHTSEGGFDPARYAVVPLRTAQTVQFIAGHHYSLELNRLVLLDRVPANAESWFCARAFRHAGQLGVRGILAYCDPVGRHRLHPGGGVDVLMPGHLGAVYAALSAMQVHRARRRTHTLLPDGTTLVGRSASKIVGGERGGRAVIDRLVQLGAIPPRPGADLASWLHRALTDVGAIEFDHPGNYKFAWRTGTAKQRRRVPIDGVIDAPYPTVRPPSVAVPTGRQR